jgi:hypothetical protein
VRTAAIIGLSAILALHSQRGAPQPSDDNEAQDFLMFLQSVASRRAARTCERGIPGYRQQFDGLFADWSARHRTRIASGEAAFRETMSKRDDPDTDYARLEQVEEALAELAQPPADTSPLTLDDQWKSICREILTELEAGLQP